MLRRSTSPLIARDVEVRAQRAPDVAWFDAVLDGLGGGPSTESRQDVIDEQRCSTHRPELAGHEFLEFRQPHATNLRRRCERFMAHPYRIFDVRDARARDTRRFAVARRRQHLADSGHQ